MSNFRSPTMAAASGSASSASVTMASLSAGPPGSGPATRRTAARRPIASSTGRRSGAAWRWRRRGSWSLARRGRPRARRGSCACRASPSRSAPGTRARRGSTSASSGATPEQLAEADLRRRADDRHDLLVGRGGSPSATSAALMQSMIGRRLSASTPSRSKRIVIQTGEEPEPLRALHGLRAVADLELAVQLARVLLDGVGREEQRLGDLRVGGARGDQVEHLLLARR